MFVSMKMVFNEDAIQYNHIIRLCPYFFYGCSKVKILIVEGAHPQLPAMQFRKEKIGGAVVMRHKQNLMDLAFVPGKALSKK